MRAAYERAERPRVAADGAPVAGRPVVALVRGTAVRSAIRDAIGELTRVIFCDDAPELVRLATEMGSRLVVAEPRDAGGESTAPALASLRLRSPGLEIVLYMSLTPEDVHDAAECVPATVVLRYHDDIGKALRAELAGTPRDASPGALLETTAALVPPIVRPFFVCCAWRAHRIRSAREAAGAVKIPPRTLSRWLRGAGLPTPKSVLDWYRVLHAAWQLEAGMRKRDAVARRVGLASGEALGAALRHCAGISWPQLRDEVGLGGLLVRFDAVLRQPGPDPPEMGRWRRGNVAR